MYICVARRKAYHVRLKCVRINSLKHFFLSRRPLPDLAEGTTWSTNYDEEDAPRLKTYTPIRDGSAYHKQFSSQQEQGQSNQNRGQRSGGQRSRGQRGKGRWELRR